VNIMTNRVLHSLIATSVVLIASLSGLNAQQSPGETVSIGSDDIGGVVTSIKGPEGGVWVIAETVGLPTKFVKIVVTDDRGRYVLPQLPKTFWR
jgi:S1-C subfamily serine protease